MKSFLISFFFFLIMETVFCFASMFVAVVAVVVVVFVVAVAVVFTFDVVAVHYDCSKKFSLILFLIAEANGAHY